MSEEDMPFNGLIINGYGIYSKNDQKALNEYISLELDKQVIQKLIQELRLLDEAIKTGATHRSTISQMITRLEASLSQSPELSSSLDKDSK